MPEPSPKKTPEFISLRQAAEICDYSQDYLSLRARQGKLKAKKIGRNWVTTKEWVKGYVEQMNNHRNSLSDKGEVSDINNSDINDIDNINVSQEAEGIAQFLKDIKAQEQATMRLVGESGSPQDSEKVEGGLLSQPSTNFRRKLVLGWEGKWKQRVAGWGESQRKMVAVLAAVLFVFVIMGSAFAYPHLGEVKDFAVEQARKVPVIASIYKERILPSQVSLKVGRADMATGWQEIGQRLGEGIRAVRQGAVAVAQKVVGIFKQEKGVPYDEYVKLEQELDSTSQELNKIKARLASPTGGQARLGQGLPVDQAGPAGGQDRLASPAGGQDRKELERLVLSGQVSAMEKIAALRQQLVGLENQLASTKAEWSGQWQSTDKKIAQIQKWESDIKTLRALASKIKAHPPTMSHPSAPLYIGSRGIQLGGTANFADLSVTGYTGLKQLGVGGSVSLGSYETDSLTVKASSVFESPIQFENEITVGTSTTNLTIAKTGDITTRGSVITEGDLTVRGSLAVKGAQTYSGAAAFEASSTVPGLKVNQTGTGYLADFQKNGTSQFYITNDGALVLVGTSTAATYVSASDDSTVRKIGEEVMRAMAPVFRYDMPAETATTSFFRISKAMPNNPLASKPSVLAGATRVYRLAIKYTDNIATTSSSQWRIYQPSTGSVLDTFTLPGKHASNLEEGAPYLTEVLDIPDSNDWQVEVKTATAPDTIRVFQIFLAAYDRVQ